METYVKQKLATKGKLYKVIKKGTFNSILNKIENNKIKKYLTTYDKNLITTIKDSSWWLNKKNNEFQVHDNTPITSINIGLEWEFWGQPTKTQIKKFGLYKEYYTDMWEVSFFKKEVPFTKKELLKTLEEFKMKMLQIKKEIKNCKISTHPIKISSTGLVFNGVHIHLSVNTKKYFHSIVKIEKIFYNINHSTLVLDKLNKLPSYRCINSHHLWGAYKDYNSRYKQKSKFKFITLTPYSTIELRAVDTEDIIYNTRRKKIIDILFNILQCKYTECTLLPSLGNGDNLRDVASLCRKFLNTNTQKVVVDKENFMRIKSNYRYINLYLNDNYLEIQ